MSFSVRRWHFGPAEADVTIRFSCEEVERKEEFSAATGASRHAWAAWQRAPSSVGLLIEAVRGAWEEREPRTKRIFGAAWEIVSIADPSGLK